MGGNAIKSPITKKSITSRINKQQYDIIKQYVINKLTAYNMAFEIFPELPGKNNFGDIDIYYEHFNIPTIYNNLKDFVMHQFFVDSTHFFVNDTIMSFALPIKLNCIDEIFNEMYNENINNEIYFQIDLIQVKYIDLAKFYFSYGGVGCVFGKMFHYNGIKFGQDGLMLNFSEKNEFGFASSEKLILSTDIEKICEFAKIDYNFWKNEFDLVTMDQIYEWFKTNDIFNDEIFEHFTTKDNDRLKELPLFSDFAGYCAKNKNEFILKRGSIKNELRKTFQMNAIKFFDKQAEFDKIKANTIKVKKFDSGKLFVHFDGVEMKHRKTILQNFQIFCMNGTEYDTWNAYVDAQSDDTMQQNISEFVVDEIVKYQAK